MEKQLVPPPKLEQVSRSGKKYYPASHYYRDETETTPKIRVFWYRTSKENTLYVLTSLYVEVVTDGTSIFNPTGYKKHLKGSLKYKAICALFNGLEDEVEPYFTPLSGTHDSWEEQIKSMAYINKLILQGKTLNNAQQGQVLRYHKYVPD